MTAQELSRELNVPQLMLGLGQHGFVIEMVVC